MGTSSGETTEDDHGGVGVGVDEAGHGQLAVGLYKALGRRRLGGVIGDGLDLAVLDVDVARGTNGETAVCIGAQGPGSCE